VIYGPNGVDLSEFNCAVRGITRPHERTFESLCNWLMRGLRINQETHTVSVQCVINRTTHALIWELMPLASNEDWLNYLQNASHWQWPLVLPVSVHQNPLINIEGMKILMKKLRGQTLRQMGPQHLNAWLMRGRTYLSLLNSCKTKNVNWTKQ
jgi:hypothetical protein